MAIKIETFEIWEIVFFETHELTRIDRNRDSMVYILDDEVIIETRLKALTGQL